MRVKQTQHKLLSIRKGRYKAAFFIGKKEERLSDFSGLPSHSKAHVEESPID